MFMKQKLLLVLSFMLVTLGLQAEEVSVKFSEKGYTNSQVVTSCEFGNGVTATFSKGSNANTSPAYYNTGSAFRLYGGNTMTITAPSNVTINSVVMTTTSDKKVHAESKVTPGTLTVSGTTATISSINAKSVTFTQGGSSGHVRIVTIKVNYTADQTAVVLPSKPTLTASRKFLGEQVVEISCSTEGAKIHYTIDGTDPTAESTEYSEPFTVNETTTVKAIAVNENGASEMATATYTKAELMSIAEAKAQSKGTEVFIDLKDAVVTVNHSNGYYIFIQDETTGVCIFSSSAKYAAGTQFTSGVIYGTTDVYNNMNQIKNAEFIGVETTTTTVEPIEVTVADLADADKYATYEGRYVKLTDVTLAGTAITQDEATYAAYDRFELGFAAKYAEATTCDIEGIPACYKTTLQIYPVVITEKEVHVHSASVFTAEGASIKAACDCGESCGSLTLVVPSDLVYNGQAKAVTVEGTIEGVETPEVVYSSEAAPVNAGTYTASITVGEATATVEYTIAAKDITGAVVGEFTEMT